MSDHGREFRIRLAEREDSNRHVTPEDILEQALEDIRNGELAPDQLMIGYRCPEEDGGFRYGSYSANLPRPDFLVFLEWIKTNLMDNWKAGS